MTTELQSSSDDSAFRIPHSELTRRCSRQHGVSLIEILIGLVIVVVASIGTLSYFSYALGGVGKTGNRRAALERVRQRLEQVAEAPLSTLPPRDGQLYWCNDVNTNGNPCTSWVAFATPVAQQVPVDDLPSQRMETSVQMVNDSSANTDGLDTLVLGVKVWFTASTATDNNLNRVYLRTLRSP